jgi:hypothetical protein
MTHLEQTIKEFDEKFIPESVKRYSDEIDINTLGIPLIPKDIKNLIIQSHIKYLQSEIERLASERRIRGLQPYLWKIGEESCFPIIDLIHEDALKICGYNTSIHDQISYLKQEIINAEKLLNK